MTSSRRRAFATCAAFVGLVACGGGGPLLTAEPVAFGAGGLTPALSIPPFDGESVALWVKSEPDTCFALASLEDAAGRAWVTGREAGPYCTDCAVRTSLARDEALIVLPSGEGFTPSEGLAVRFGLMDCETLTPVETGGGQRLQLAWLPRERLPERGRLSLRFLVSQHSMLLGQPERQRELLERLNDELQEAGLEVTLDAVAELPDVPSETRFWTTGLAELEALLERAPPALDATVDVVFAGCLQYDDPFFGPPTPVNGFTPRVGGGAGPASAVFMPGLRCDSFAAGPTPWPLDAYARVLAHELGHFLGLYHSVETDGTTDLLSDTGEQNIMHHNPSRADARGWSASQGRRLRGHPWVISGLGGERRLAPPSAAEQRACGTR
ncbi:M43 family zinc metalloprotease [Archangium violaceum]|uniref:Peptidase M43 pregnancy-associated plasma-A domain-containing protein n=1 Tax=Archangium violaceum Cb vi76 TaxID=1406225 RepID=A0A084SPT7_9BACT|nr:M43 family zinc metalloprotease [Archangium violaceum]KFA90472.1 hypothetical protein Q664_28190 [Archangium violaceum Cb vi76]